MRFKFLLGIALLGVFGLTSGCASIVGGTTQPVSVTTPGCESASCELTNGKGKWYIPTTPGTVTVARAYAELVVLCSKEGFDSASASAKSSTKGLAFGNILFGGVIGAGVDMGTGAAYDYPGEISVPMDCKKVAQTIAPPTVEPTATPTTSVPSAGKWKLGCVVENVNKEFAALQGLAENTGVVVTSVAPGSLAAAQGIQLGDALISLNGITVSDAPSLRDMLSKHDGRSPVRLEVVRNRKSFFVEILPATQGAI